MSFWYSFRNEVCLGYSQSIWSFNEYRTDTVSCLHPTQRNILRWLKNDEMEFT